MKTLSELFENLSFLIYEMTNPTDPFGKMMVTNIEVLNKNQYNQQRGCKLLGLKECKSLEDQRKRLEDIGMTSVEAFTMLDVYNKYVDVEERKRIEKLEIFDEFEQWNLIQSHYCLCLGTKFNVELSSLFSQIKIKN